MNPLWKEKPYANIAMHGHKYHDERRVAEHTSANIPQKKINTAAETAIFSAASSETTLPSASSQRSNNTLFHRCVSQNHGACPRSTSCASHALYIWLPKSPATIVRCQKHGTSTTAEMVRNFHKWSRTYVMECASTGARGEVCASVCFSPRS